MLFQKSAVMHFTVKLVLFKTAPYLSPPAKSRPTLQVPLNKYMLIMVLYAQIKQMEAVI